MIVILNIQLIKVCVNYFLNLKFVINMHVAWEKESLPTINPFWIPLKFLNELNKGTSLEESDLRN